MSYIFSLTRGLSIIQVHGIATDRAIDGDIRDHMSIIEKKTLSIVISSN